MALVNSTFSVKAASTGNLTLSGAQTVDGIALVAGEQCLAKDQTTASENDTYIVTAAGWVRLNLIVGDSVNVDQGTVNADTGWVVQSTGPHVFIPYSISGKIQSDIIFANDASNREIKFGPRETTSFGRALTITGGDGSLDNNSGSVVVVGGQASGTGLAGGVTLRGGPSIGSAAAGTASLLGGTNSGSGAGGNVLIRGGLGVSANGNIKIGQTNTSSIDIGSASIVTGITASVINLVGTSTVIGTGSIHTLTINSDIVGDLFFDQGTTHNISGSQEANGVNGFGLTINPARGGNASGAAAGIGGEFLLVAGTGGSGDAGFDPGAGGDLIVRGGGGGILGGFGGGANGGDVFINGGPKTGTGLDGIVWLGSSSTTSIQLGNANNNTTITQIGAGAVTFEGAMTMRGGLSVTGGDLVIKSLASGSFTGSHVTFRTGGVQTTSLDRTTLISFTMVSGTMYWFEIRWSAKDNVDLTQYGAGSRWCTAYRDSTSAAILVNQTNIWYQAHTSWGDALDDSAIIFDVSGNDIRVRVKGTEERLTTWTGLLICQGSAAI